MVDGAFSCPHCGTALDATPEESPRDVVCPRCGALAIIPAIDEEIDQADELAPSRDPDDELSSVRIRQLAAGRRAAYRSRSYCVIGALVCVVAVVQLTWNGIVLLRATGAGFQTTAYLLAAGAAGWGALYFFRKAMEMDREAKRSALPEATGEPDFGPLSDGSQRWKDLEDIQ